MTHSILRAADDLDHARGAHWSKISKRENEKISYIRSQSYTLCYDMEQNKQEIYVTRHYVKSKYQIG